ncbi:hypothetical protein H6A03_02660 [[Clostridium] spiroforme]|nr:hypothetical protein [Thomasclavelia spiroformis]MBM6879838.1 hypothetical protein [Thomasclavelia spiroformis]MBM6930789.1 hypothetical protein [Thomasclavelia spiroformis]
MKNKKDKIALDFIETEDKEDISESVDYLKHVFGSVMDVIFGEDNHQQSNCQKCKKK